MILKKKKKAPTTEELFEKLLTEILDEKAKKKWEYLKRI